MDLLSIGDAPVQNTPDICTAIQDKASTVDVLSLSSLQLVTPAATPAVVAPILDLLDGLGTNPPVPGNKYFVKFPKHTHIHTYS